MIGHVSVEPLENNLLFVAGREIPGVVPTCQVGDEIILSVGVEHHHEPETRVNPGGDEYRVDGPVSGQVFRGGKPIRDLGAVEADAIYTIAGGKDLDEVFIADAVENEEPDCD